MNTRTARTALLLAALVGRTFLLAAAEPSAPLPRILIANDTCPDVTWGFTEAETRQAFADLIAAHLDEMTRTDSGPPENRNHYNVMAFVEAEAFLERYPGRKDEFLRRAREGRISISPFLCNTLWGFQSVEGVLRAFYPARRMERDHGVPLVVANHTELPSLPWGMATLLPACGFRWASVPFLDYDCTFKGLKNPPLFRLEGPDGGEIRVILDAWASLKGNYMQGGWLLQDPKRITADWLPRYANLGRAWPLGITYASGTHSDIHPNSGKQARGFADAIARYNTAGTNPAVLVNGTVAQFCREVDAAESAAPFLPKLRGCFGHSWELWPVSLANLVAGARQNERAFLAAESLVALAGLQAPALASRTQSARQHAEWCWAMLGDHAWNGTDLKNKRHNAELRRGWADQVRKISESLTSEAWRELGLKPDPNRVTVFNPLSFSNDILVECDAPESRHEVWAGRERVASLSFVEGGRRRVKFLARRVPAFGFREFRLKEDRLVLGVPPFSVGSNSIAGPFYRLVLDGRTGGFSSVVYRPTGQELVSPGSERTLAQTVFFDGSEQPMTDIQTEGQFDDFFCAELRVMGRIGGIRVTQRTTLYRDLDRIDFEFHVEKPPTTNEQRLVHVFPVNLGPGDLRIETTAAVLRPAPQPEGDLLPGADTRRFAVQGFVDVSPPDRTGVTIAPLDAYMLRLDQGVPAFEALGNDQNWKEVTQDQDGERHFRFRYSLRAHSPGYNQAAALAWSRSVAAPPTVAYGRLPGRLLERAHLSVDPSQALVTCFKPTDDAMPGKAMVRLWKTAAGTGPVIVRVPGFPRATVTDLLERERGTASVEKGAVAVTVPPFGFVGVALER